MRGRGRPAKGLKRPISTKFVWVEFADNGQTVFPWFEIKELINVNPENTDLDRLIGTEATPVSRPTWIGTIKKIGDDEQALQDEVDKFCDEADQASSSSSSSAESNDDDDVEMDVRYSTKSRPISRPKKYRAEEFEFYDTLADQKKKKLVKDQVAIERKAKRESKESAKRRRDDKNLKMFSQINMKAKKNASNDKIIESTSSTQSSAESPTPPEEVNINADETEIRDLETLLLLRDAEILSLKEKNEELMQAAKSGGNLNSRDLDKLNTCVSMLKEVAASCFLDKNCGQDTIKTAALISKQGEIHCDEQFDGGLSSFEIVALSEERFRSSSPILMEQINSGFVEDKDPLSSGGPVVLHHGEELPDARPSQLNDAASGLLDSSQIETPPSAANESQESLIVDSEEFNFLNNNLVAQLKHKFRNDDPTFHIIIPSKVGLPEINWQLCVRKSKSASEFAMNLTRALVDADVLPKLSLAASLKGGDHKKSKATAPVPSDEKVRKPGIAQELLTAILESTKKIANQLKTRAETNEKLIKAGKPPLGPLLDEKGIPVKDKLLALWSDDKIADTYLRSAIGRAFRLGRNNAN